MIPKTIHYCWFGGGPMPGIALKCIESWHKYMPDWEYKLWNEENFDVNSVPYTREAYRAKKYAFVSDYVRLLALSKNGGVYLDTDVEVYKSFAQLLSNRAFAGYEGSKNTPVGTCVLASESDGMWVNEQLSLYEFRHFILDDGTMDMTTNVQFMNTFIRSKGVILNGFEQYYLDLHIYPVDYFCPGHTTGEFIKTENTYCDHKGLSSWSLPNGGWKHQILSCFSLKTRIRLIKLKRRIFG